MASVAQPVLEPDDEPDPGSTDELARGIDGWVSAVGDEVAPEDDDVSTARRRPPPHRPVRWPAGTRWSQRRQPPITSG